MSVKLLLNLIAHFKIKSSHTQTALQINPTRGLLSDLQGSFSDYKKTVNLNQLALFFKVSYIHNLTIR